MEGECVTLALPGIIGGKHGLLSLSMERRLAARTEAAAGSRTRRHPGSRQDHRAGAAAEKPAAWGIAPDRRKPPRPAANDGSPRPADRTTRPKCSRRRCSSSRWGDLPVRRGVGFQFRPVAGDVGGVGGLESGPQLRQAKLLPHRPLPMPCAAVQFAVQLQAQSQQFGAGKVEAVASARQGPAEAGGP